MRAAFDVTDQYSLAHTSHLVLCVQLPLYTKEVWSRKVTYKKIIYILYEECTQVTPSLLKNLSVERLNGEHIPRNNQVRDRKKKLSRNSYARGTYRSPKIQFHGIAERGHNAGQYSERSYFVRARQRTSLLRPFSLSLKFYIHKFDVPDSFRYINDG